MNSTVAYTLYRPEGDAKAVVQIVHGMQEHRKRYDDFANYLKDHGYVVVTFDLPGHGESVKEGNPLGYFGEDGGWDHLIDSAYQLMKDVKKEYSDLNYYILGHSMGSMVSRCFIQTYDGEIDGLILSGAPTYNKAAKSGVTVAKSVRAIKGKKGLSKMLDNLATGGFNKGIKDARTELDWLSYNPDNVDAYIADELCGVPFTVQGYIDELEGMIRMADVRKYQVANKDLPIYFFGGEDDPCIGGHKGLSHSVQTLKDAGYNDIETRLYPGMRHETLNEKEHQKVYCDVLEWLNRKNSL